MVNVQFAEDIVSPLAEEQIQLAVEEALRQAGATPEVDLAVVLTDDRELHRLNRDYLGIDAPTDVLSFPAGFVDPDSNQTYLGDILISLERARQQAEVSQHAVQQELLLLIVHGVLHLLGYDHAEKEEKERMWSLQEKIIAHLASGESKT
jgi:probable rRNA maturation factor